MYPDRNDTPSTPAGTDTDNGNVAGRRSPSRSAPQIRSDPVRLARVGALPAVLLITATAVFGASSAAQASANKCSGGLHRSCIDVKGKHRHVDRISSQIIPAGKSCIFGHSQVMIGGQHYADSHYGRDVHYCGTGYPGTKITTWTWYLDRTYAKGTTICAKFWQKIDGMYRASRNACATVG